MGIRTLLTLFFVITLCHTLLPKTEYQFGPRRLIILFDPHAQETSTSQSFAIMSGLIAALEQKAAPILVSESLWHNFVIRRERYDLLKDKKFTGPLILMELLEKYGKDFAGKNYLLNDITRDKLRDLYAAHYGYYQKALAITSKNKDLIGRPNGAAMTALNSINVSERELQPNHPFRTDIDFDFVTYKTQFDPNEWSVYHIPHFMYLLIPKVYEEKIYPPTSALKDIPTFPNVSGRELRLGLKVDHLQKVSDPLKLPERSVSKKQESTTKDAEIGNIFVTRNDLGLVRSHSPIKAPESYESYLGAWNIYATGHGSPDTSTSLEEQIKEKERLIKQAVDDTAEMTNFIKQNSKEINEHRAKLKTARTAADQAFNSGAIQIKEDTNAKIEEHIHNVNLLRLSLMEDLINLHQGKSRQGGVIAGLYQDEFKEVLNFFNTAVNTRTFFYDTCFSGGKNLEAPYQYTGVPATFNYTIISGASVDAPTTVGKAQIAVPPYTSAAGTLFVKVVKRTGKDDLWLYVDQEFDKYFDQLEKYQEGTFKEPLADILNTIHSFKIPELHKYHNIPLIRFPNTAWFNVVDMRTKVTSITEQAVIRHHVEQTEFKLTTQEALLLYTRHISMPITTNSPSMPAVISMIGGNADHYLSELTAPKANLSDIIQKFLAVKNEYFTKRFFIKKLTCKIDINASYNAMLTGRKGDVVTLLDVVIFQNDTELFTDDKKVNAVVFTYTGVGGSSIMPHRAVWPASESLSAGEIPNLDWSTNTSDKGKKQLKKTEQAFAIVSRPPQSRAEGIKGREHVRTLVQKRTAALIQNYKNAQRIGPDAVTAWIATLTPDDRKMLNIVEPKEASTKTTITKKEFDTWRKTLEKENEPIMTGPKRETPLVTALQNVQRNLRNLEQRLR